MNKLRLISFVIFIVAIMWLALDHLRFRHSLRTSLNAARSVSNELKLESTSGSTDKVLNFYYESVYADLPHVTLPVFLLVAGSTALLLFRKPVPESNFGALPR
jgi:hypothetical protein